MSNTAPAKLRIGQRIVLRDPIEQPDAEHPRRYGVPTFFQVSQTQVALIANRRVACMPVVDHEDGWDIFIIDDLAKVTADRAQPGNRNHRENHPKTGEPLSMVHYLPVGGFVPLGAKLPDGRDHPHAGTGFATQAVVGHPAEFSSSVPLHRGQPNHSYIMVLQYRFDGERLHITSSRRLEHSATVLGWHLGGSGLSPALPDGEDLLFVMIGGIMDAAVEEYFKKLEMLGNSVRRGHERLGECVGPVFTRWRRGDDGWQIVEISRVIEPGPDMSGEPTLVRDHDGSLLCSVRSKGSNAEPGERDEVGMENLYQAFRVYRSTDVGRTWERCLCIPVIRSASPVMLNRLGDGTVFLVANPTVPLETDSKGRTVAMVHQRQRLWMWPLTDDRRDVCDPLCVLDAPAELGPPRPLECHACDNRWYLDHALGMPVRLGDGRWHNLLGFRVTDGATNSGGADAPPQGGLWAMEIPGDMKPPYPWRFDDDE